MKYQWFWNKQEAAVNPLLIVWDLQELAVKPFAHFSNEILLAAGGWLELSAGGWLMLSQLWWPLCMLVQKGCWLASMLCLGSHTLDALRGRRINVLESPEGCCEDICTFFN